MRQLAAGREGYLIVMADRPSPSVIAALQDLERDLPMTVEFIDAPCKLRSAEGREWTLATQFMYSHLREYKCDAAMLWDDDCIFSTLAMKELRDHLEFFEGDRVEAEWLNCTDPARDSYDSSFPVHRATCLFKCYRDDDWSDILTRTTAGGGTHSPIYVARSHDYSALQGRVLHMGYCSEDQRAQAWNAAKASGQTCPYFRTLSKPPIKKKCKGPGETWQ